MNKMNTRTKNEEHTHKISYRTLMKNYQENNIEIGSFEHYIVYWIREMMIAERDNGWGEDGQIYKIFFSDIKKIRSLEEMEDYILSFSCTDEEYSSHWAEEQEKNYFKFNTDHRDLVQLWGPDDRYFEIYPFEKNKNYIDEDDLRIELDQIWTEYYRDDIDEIEEQEQRDGEEADYFYYNLLQKIERLLDRSVFTKNIIREYIHLFRELFNKFNKFQFKRIHYYSDRDEELFHYNAKNISEQMKININIFDIQ